MDNEDEDEDEQEELTYYEHQQQHLRQVREEETRIRENETRIREEQRMKEEKKIRRQQKVDRFYEESELTFYTLAGDPLTVPIKYIFSEMSNRWTMWGSKFVKITKVDMVPKIEKYITDVYGYGEITLIQNDVIDLNGDLREGVIFYEKGSNTHMYLLNDIELSHYPRWYKALNNSTIVFGD